MPTRIKNHDIEADTIESDRLAEFDVAGASDGDTLIYNNATGYFEPAVPSGAEVIDDLTDVNTGTPSDGDVLTWDNVNSKWISEAPAAVVDMTAMHIHMAKAVSSQSIANNTATAIEFDTTINDPQNAWDSNNHAFIVPADGTYVLTVAAFVDNAGSGSWRLQPAIAVNGSNMWSTQTVSTVSSLKLISGSVVLNLSEGDSVQILVNQNSGTSANIVATSFRTLFTAARIGS